MVLLLGGRCGKTRAKGNTTAKPQPRDSWSPWKVAVEEHLAARRAAPPRLPREAYVTMWWGDTTARAFDGLVTMVHSLRRFDARREIVVMTPVPKPLFDRHEESPPVDPNMQRVLRAFAPMSTVRVPFMTIFRNTNLTCQTIGACGMGTATSYGGGRKPSASSGYDSYVFSYTKFALWNLTAFTKLMYIDNDVLVMQPTDGLWAAPLGGRNLAAASLAIKAKTYKGIGEAECNGDGSIPKSVHVGRIKFNAGVHMIEPSAVLYQAILKLMNGEWRRNWKTPCASDQRYFNFLLAKWHMHCWPMSANCRDPQFIEREAPPDGLAPVSRLSRCLDSAPLSNGSRTTMAVPYMVHMACKSKPWLPANAKTFFAVEWHKRRAEAHVRMRAV